MDSKLEEGVRFFEVQRMTILNVKIKNIFCVLFTLLFQHYMAGAASIHYNYKQITIQDGLSHSNTTSALKDKRGRLWIGTTSGLNVFDQRDLTVYLHDKSNPLSLPSNNILFIMEDARNNIWISTSKGLLQYQNESNGFMPYIEESVYGYMLTPEGILFSGDNALYRYNYDNHSYYIIPVTTSSESVRRERYKIMSMHALNEDDILLSSKNDGFFRYNMQTDSIEALPFGHKLTLTAIHVDDDGTIYCSYFNRGLFCYNKKGELFAHYTTENSRLSNDVIMDITKEKGDLWLATDGGGISILDRTGNSFRVLDHTPGDPSSLPVNSITHFYHDPEDNLWLGSVRGGLIQVKETFIRLYKDVALDNNNGLSEKVIISLFEDDDSILWIGTDGGGINRYNPFNNQFKHFPETYGDKVVSITDLTDQELLVSLFSKGVFVFNKSKGEYSPFTIVNDSIHQLESFGGFMPLIHRVGDDEILILSRSVYVYHPSNGNFTPVTPANEDTDISALALHHVDKNHIFLSKENTIFMLDRENYELKELTRLEMVEIIHSVSFDGHDTLWIGSDMGLSYYQIEEDSLHQIKTKMFNEITNLHLDHRGILWINAQNSLFSYVTAQDRFIIWGESEGFSTNEILYKYHKPSKTNNIYMGSINGLVIIDKNISNRRTKHKDLSLLNVIYNGKSYLDGYDEKEQSIDIPINYTSLSVIMGLSGSDFFSNDLYRYTVSGLNHEFIETYNQRINLPRLTPGSYVINASYVTDSGEWSPSERIITINILPPWYLSTWFILIATVIVMAIIGAVVTILYRRNKYRLELEKKGMEQKVNEEKIRFLVNVSHELRTPLTLIYAPLKRMLSGRVLPEQWSDQLNNIFRHTLQMKNVINMVLDINKLDTGYDSINKEVNHLNGWLKEVGDDFSDELEYKQIQLKYAFDENITMVEYDKNKCKIVISNMLMNALKFSEKGSGITIATEKRDNEVLVSVIDQGIGLQHTDSSKLFSRFYQGDHNEGGSGIGLSYSKALVEKHGGTIGALKNSDRGATFFFTLPLNGDEHFRQVEKTAAVSSNEEFNPLDTSGINMTHPAIGINTGSNIDLSSSSILIVDDNIEFLSFLRESFTDQFGKVWEATNGQEALELLDELQPDIIVSDVMMPRIDGYELCRRIKSSIEISHIPVILLTAKSDAESIEIGYKLGADFYIPKPFNPDFLGLIISNLLTSREAIKARYRDSEEPIEPEDVTISSADEKFMIRFNKLILDNLSNPDLNVDYLASEVAMSRASLYNKMQSLLGIGINDYINKFRIDKASELLLKSDMSMGEISFETGFRYPRYFSTVFKKTKGISPTRYRNKRKETD